jgi:hypothetical protein
MALSGVITPNQQSLGTDGAAWAGTVMVKQANSAAAKVRIMHRFCQWPRALSKAAERAMLENAKAGLRKQLSARQILQAARIDFGGQ